MTIFNHPVSNKDLKASMIHINNLSKIIQGRTILDVNTVHVDAGEIIAIVGPTGSGLEIFLELLTGKASPSAGEITIEGLIPGKDRKELDERIGVLFQNDSLYTNLSAEKNLQFFARLYGLPHKRITETLREIGLADQAKVKVGDLPSGLARRLALGRVFLHQPSILILAYPFARCDQDSLTLIKDLLRQKANQGKTIMILDEDTANLSGLCSRIYFLKQGRIEQILEEDQPHPTELPFKIPVKLEGKVILLNPADILYAEADQGYTLLITKDSRLTSQYTLNELEERLKGAGFFRAHRSYIVNLQHVREVIPYSRNSFSLRLNDSEKTEIPLSKNSAAELRDFLNY
jgi:ABC-2 type transport system ATP-binding protein